MKPVEHLVLLHGWGGDGRIWQPLLDGGNFDWPVTCLELPGFGGNEQPWPDDEALLQWLYGRLPHNCLLLGHSLGGMLAARLTALPGQEKIAGLMTIAANASFVQRGDWPGMDPRTFADFRQSMSAEPETTREKFCGLQARGDSAMRAVLKQLKSWQPEEIGAQWLDALDCLGRLDNRAVLAEVAVPSLHLFGEKDALVPAAAAENIRALGAGVEILPDCGHTPQVSCPERIAEQVLGFVRANTRFAPAESAPVNGGGESCVRPAESGESPFEKSVVARSFGRAAASYDNAAHLQRAVCRQLLSQAAGEQTPKTILDLGSGTGYGSELLRKRFPQAAIIALDLAEGMLRYARGERSTADAHIAADAEQLPLADGSVELVFSSMALQWCYRLPQLFAELQRVLSDGGRCLVSTLGPETLHELKQSWAQVDGGVHVNRFLPLDEWRRAAADNGLPGQVQREQRVLHFGDVRQLMRELKSIGAHNVNRDAGKGLSGREKLRRLAAAYESQRTPAGLPASYEVIYLRLAKAVTGSCRVRRAHH